MIEDDWDILEGTKLQPKSELATIAADRLEPMANEYHSLSLENERIGERMGQLEGEMGHLFPEEVGELAISTRTFEVVVKRAERWSWNKKLLEEIYSQGEIPEYINRSLTVDKRKFQKLPRVEQDNLKPALTRKLDSPKIKVIRHV